ncbi:MAG: enoyl-CoA hydratase-related protein [Candidatus Thorarchaeota archaeon]
MLALPTFSTLDLNLNAKNALYVKINRPDVHNAMNEQVIDDLIHCATFIENSSVRVVILSGKGKSFCAGADLNYMKRSKDFTFQQNLNDAKQMSLMFELWNTLSKPVIGKITGFTIGGGTGLVAACDIAIAEENAKFGFSEVKLGIVPAIISPYILRKIGFTYTREFFLTGQRFSAEKAKQISLINYVVNSEELDGKVEEIISELLTSGPEAIRAGKELINKNLLLEKTELQNYCVDLIAKLRKSPEGQEGISAFLEKRKTNW